MDRPTRPVPPVPSNSRFALTVRFGALDPEGSLSDNERHKKRKRATFKSLIFYKRNTFKIEQLKQTWPSILYQQKTQSLQLYQKNPFKFKK